MIIRTEAWSTQRGYGSSWAMPTREPLGIYQCHETAADGNVHMSRHNASRCLRGIDAYRGYRRLGGQTEVARQQCGCQQNTENDALRSVAILRAPRCRSCGESYRGERRGGERHRGKWHRGEWHCFRLFLKSVVKRSFHVSSNCSGLVERCVVILAAVGHCIEWRQSVGNIGNRRSDI